jgi:hypothetical protein
MMPGSITIDMKGRIEATLAVSNRAENRLTIMTP